MTVLINSSCVLITLLTDSLIDKYTVNLIKEVLQNDKVPVKRLSDA